MENPLCSSKDESTIRGKLTCDLYQPTADVIFKRKFSCLNCEKAFKASSELKAHERTHTGEKPFSCSKCAKKFSHPGNLKRHQRIHYDKKSIQLPHINKTLNWHT